MNLDELECLEKLDRDGCAFFTSWTILRRTPTQDRCAAVAYIYAKLGKRIGGRRGGHQDIASDLSIAQLDMLIVELVGYVPQDEPRPFTRNEFKRVPDCEQEDAATTHGDAAMQEIVRDSDLIHDLIENPFGEASDD